jgi:hypothetical protein
MGKKIVADLPTGRQPGDRCVSRRQAAHEKTIRVKNLANTLSILIFTVVAALIWLTADILNNNRSSIFAA